MLLVKKTDLLVRRVIFSGWQTEKLKCISYVIGFIVVRVIARDLVIILVGLIMVKIVNMELVEGLIKIKTIKAVAVDLIRMSIRFIVIN